MPELPEVEVIRRALEPRLLGRRVVDVQSSEHDLRLPIDLGAWRRLVVGRTLRRLERRGKYLLLHWDGAIGVIHLGMSGRLALAPAELPRPPHTHLAFTLDDGCELRLADPRRFGLAVALRAGELEDFAPVASLGPDPLSDDIVPALGRVRRSRAPIRNLLLDQRMIAGLGNIYATEALHRAGIHPGCPARRLGPRRLGRLAVAVRAVLEDALSAGGTTLADGGFSDPFGEIGNFAVALSVYGREGLACPRCTRPILRRVLGGRSVYYCPGCQRA